MEKKKKRFDSSFLSFPVSFFFSPSFERPVVFASRLGSETPSAGSKRPLEEEEVRAAAEEKPRPPRGFFVVFGSFSPEKRFCGPRMGTSFLFFLSCFSLSLPPKKRRGKTKTRERGFFRKEKRSNGARERLQISKKIFSEKKKFPKKEASFNFTNVETGSWSLSGFLPVGLSQDTAGGPYRGELGPLFRSGKSSKEKKKKKRRKGKKAVCRFFVFLLAFFLLAFLCFLKGKGWLFLFVVFKNSFFFFLLFFFFLSSFFFSMEPKTQPGQNHHFSFCL